MRKLFIFIFLLPFLHCNAQLDISTSFNSVHIGRNIDLGISKSYNNHTVGISIKYNINSIITDNQNEVYKKRFYALSFPEHIVLNLVYYYNINLKKSPITPYLFYSLQLSNSHTRNRGYLADHLDSTGNRMFYREYLVFFGPTISMENYIGLGYCVDLFSHLYLSSKIGIGIIPYFNVDDRLYGNRYSIEFGKIISIGLGYRISN